MNSVKMDFHPVEKRKTVCASDLEVGRQAARRGVLSRPFGGARLSCPLNQNGSSNATQRTRQAGPSESAKAQPPFIPRMRGESIYPSPRAGRVGEGLNPRRPRKRDGLANIAPWTRQAGPSDCCPRGTGNHCGLSAGFEAYHSMT